MQWSLQEKAISAFRQKIASRNAPRLALSVVRNVAAKAPENVIEPAVTNDYKAGDRRYEPTGTKE